MILLNSNFVAQQSDDANNFLLVIPRAKPTQTPLPEKNLLLVFETLGNDRILYLDCLMNTKINHECF